MQRRTVLQAGIAASVFQIVPRHVLGGPGHTPPSETIHIALIGAGGRGRQVLRGMLAEEGVRAIAVADPATEYSLQRFYYRDVGGREPTRELIDRHYQEQGRAGRCAVYEDFREMLQAERDLDAVVCATPDHLHAYVSALALKAGKHVYCEKPLTHNIAEARYLADLAASSGLATQMGNQGHSADGMRQTLEWLAAGAIGQVQRVEAWVGGHRWNPTLTGRPEEQNDAPPWLNWDLWMGPREGYRFSDAYVPVAWRDFWAFGNSNIGDFGCHDLDAACWALDLAAPTSIEFHPAGPSNQEIGPHGCVGYYHFPATEKRGPVEVTWMDGGLKPRRPVGWDANRPLPSRGILFHGSEGVLFCGGAGGVPRLVHPRGQFQPPSPTLRRVANHARDWLDGIRGGPTPGSHFPYGARLTEIALLGALSLRTGRAIRWDAANMRAIDLPDADSIIREPRRSGWELPE